MEKHVVLFVDDDSHILKAIERLVADEEYTSIYAESGKEALKLLKTQPITVVITDINMPGIDGLAVLHEVKKASPDTVRIILSGHTEADQMLEAVNSGEVFRYIVKPWPQGKEFLAIIRQAIDYYDLKQGKRRQEQLLVQRNTSYQNMLRTMDEQIYRHRQELIHVKHLVGSALDMLSGELVRKSSQKSQAFGEKERLQVFLLNQIITGYIDQLPQTVQEFAVQDVVSVMQEQVRHQGEKLKLRMVPEKIAANRLFGNHRILTFVTGVLFDLLARAGTKRTFVCRITSQNYGDVSQFSAIIEIGHVDGVSVMIDDTELLAGDNFNFYAMLLSQLGKPFDIHVVFTYITPNASVITVTANFLNGKNQG